MKQSFYDGLVKNYSPLDGLVPKDMDTEVSVAVYLTEKLVAKKHELFEIGVCSNGYPAGPEKPFICVMALDKPPLELGNSYLISAQPKRSKSSSSDMSPPELWHFGMLESEFAQYDGPDKPPLGPGNSHHIKNMPDINQFEIIKGYLSRATRMPLLGISKNRNLEIYFFSGDIVKIQQNRDHEENTMLVEFVSQYGVDELILHDRSTNLVTPSSNIRVNVGPKGGRPTQIMPGSEPQFA